MRIWPKDPILAGVLGVLFWFSFIVIDALIVYVGFIEYVMLIEVPIHVLLVFSCCAIYFRQVKEHEHFMAESIFLGFLWVITTIILDMLVLAPFLGFSTTEYLLNVGWEYVSLPFETLIFGVFVHYTALQDYF
jgi:hypothetical protein